ncbi:MAG: acylase [Gemmatimonadota bacterium]
MRRLAVVFALSWFTAPAGGQQLYTPRSGTEILWDTYGVPHVFARDSRSMFYAFGWAQMQSHGDLLLRLYGQARGRAAEYWGADFLDSDRWVRVNGVPERGERWYRQTRPEFRGFLDAFVAGVNAYAAQHPEKLHADVKPVLPVRASDVLAHTNRVMQYSFIANPRTAEAGEAFLRGSNGWAIAPKRSASGNAMLLANPHLPWGDLFTWYEAQLTSSDVQIYGAALVGMPAINIGFSERLGWTHTVNTFDGADLYELTLVTGGYRWNGGVRAFDQSQELIRIREGETYKTDTLTILRSVHGPVIARAGSKALALRVVGNEQPHLLEQYWRMSRADGLSEFEDALRRLQLPMFTVLYADRDGHILHLFNGRVPVRARGDWAFWNRPVAGDTSELLWIRTHAYSDLPRVVDPESGWLQNANDPPWSTTIPAALDPGRYPPYMAPRTPPSFRPQHSLRMLASDSSITFTELVGYKHSTRLELADRILDELIAAARTHGSARARQAADVLQRWDRSANAESRGAVLFDAFYRATARRRWPGNSLFAVRWNESRPLSTPDGLSDAEQAVAVLDEAAGQVMQSWGTLDVRWGDVYRLRRDRVDLPANGAGGELGAFRVLNYERTGGTFTAVSGDSYVAAIEFSRPVRALTLLAYGNASQPDSPHRTDQLQLFARQELRPAWLRREDVMRHLEERKRF